MNIQSNMRDPFGLREDWETLQPEGWNAYSSEVWNMSAPGPNTPAWYPYVEGAIVAGPAVALIGAGSVIAAPIIAEGAYTIGTGIMDYMIANEATAATASLVLTHPTEANEFMGGVASGYSGAYLDWETKLLPNSAFEALGEASGRLMGEMRLRIDNSLRNFDITNVLTEDSLAVNEQGHPKKQ